MKKMILLISMLVFLVVSLYGQSKNNLPNYGYPLMKLEKPDWTLLAGHKLKANRLAKVAGLPAVVDNTAWMPPVGDQGNENSCTAFAVAYALGEMRNKQIGYSQNNQFSQAFLYNLGNGQNVGSSFEGIFSVASEAGCAKLSDFPYIAGDWQTMPSYSVLSKAISNSISDWSYFVVGDTTTNIYVQAPGYEGINTARALLAAGQPVVMSIGLTGAYGSAMQADNWIYSYADFGQWPITGAHALCLVGYDDTMQTKDGPGAFLFINSWGANTFINGYCWITYKMLALTNYMGLFATFTPRPVDYQPEFKVGINVDSLVNMANSFYIGLKVNGQTFQEPLWEYRWNNQYYSGRYFQPVPDTTIVDLTDLAEHIDTTGKLNTLFISGYFLGNLFGTVFPKIKSLHLVDKAKGIDTVIVANLKVEDTTYLATFYAEWSFRTGEITGVDGPKNSVPASFSLSQNYPNPFNPTTTINFSLPKSDRVVLKVYNLLGQEVALLINQYETAGSHSVKFDASRLPSGVYIYQLNAGSFNSVKKMMLLK